MNRSKRVAALWVSILLAWLGLCQLRPQVPLAGERQASATDSRAVRETKTSPPAGSVELRSRVEQPTAILSIVPPGESVKEGDLLVELDCAALMDKRIQQVLDVRKAETEMILARESQERDKRAAAGQVALAEKALRLAQAQLKAFVEDQFARQLALAEGAAAVAKLKYVMAEERVKQLQADKTQTEQTVASALQEAQIAQQETRVQLDAAESALAHLKGAGHDNKIAELELVVAQRQFDLARAEDAVSAAATRGAATVPLAEMIRQMEADRLAKLDDQIVKCKVYAPQDGTVVYPDDADAAALKPGVVVREGQILIRLVPIAQRKP
jgi:HlyD family secretion protein